jgi:hypothetical protein
MKKHKTVDDQIWADVDHAVRSRENKKENLQHVPRTIADDVEKKRIAETWWTQRETVHTGALHVSGADRQIKKGMVQEQLDRANELLQKVWDTAPLPKSPVDKEVYQYLTENKLIDNNR